MMSAQMRMSPQRKQLQRNKQPSRIVSNQNQRRKKLTLIVMRPVGMLQMATDIRMETAKKDSSKDEFDVSDSGSDFEGGFAKKVPAKKLGTSDDLFDSMMADEDKPAAPAKKPVNKRPGLYSDDDGSDSDASPKAKKAPAPKKKPAKKSFDSDEFDSDIDEPKPKKTAAAKPKAAPKPKAPKAEKKKPAPKKKAGSGSDSDAPKSKKAKPAKKKTFDSDEMSGSDFEVTDIGPAKDRPGRGRKA